MKPGFDQSTIRKTLYRQYRDRLDPRAVLDHYGAENQRETIASDGTTEIIHSCLIDRIEPHHRNGDRNPSASLNVDRKLYKCWSYWGGDLFSLVMKMESSDSLALTIPTLSEFFSGDMQGFELKAKLKTIFANSYDSNHVDLPVYSEQILKQWEYFHPYLATRGITPEAALQLKLGFDPITKRITFPHYIDGVLVGWQQRVLPESVEQYPKYKNNRGFPRQSSLYNYDTAREYKNIVVVESPMSVAKSVSLGYENIVATFGGAVSEEQLQQLRDFNRVYVWMDDDNSGYKGERSLVEGLWRHVEVRVVTPDPDRDLADCETAKELIDKLASARPSFLKLAEYRLRGRYTDGR